MGNGSALSQRFRDERARLAVCQLVNEARHSGLWLLARSMKPAQHKVAHGRMLNPARVEVSKRPFAKFIMQEKELQEPELTRSRAGDRAGFSGVVLVA